MNLKRVVLSISGGLLLSKKDGSAFMEWHRAVRTAAKNLEMMCVVTGGGNVAREYINMAKNLKLDIEKQDMIGIAVTRVNALLLSMKLGWNEIIPTSYEEALNQLRQKRFIVCGGMIPGQSTDKVAADLASMIRADAVLNATKVDGVYDREPSLPDARLIKKLSYDELRNILRGEEQLPGKYTLFDLAGIDVLKEAGVPLIIFNGKDASDLLRIIDGEDIGSLVV